MSRTINTMSTILAVLCLIALGPWILGIPGVDSDYARGWTLGLAALIGFPLVHRLLSLLETGAGRGRFGLQPHWGVRLRLVAFLTFAIAQVWAWSLILR
jgi:hypothetical protein